MLTVFASSISKPGGEAIAKATVNFQGPNGKMAMRLLEGYYRESGLTTEAPELQRFTTALAKNDKEEFTMFLMKQSKDTIDNINRYFDELDSPSEEAVKAAEDAPIKTQLETAVANFLGPNGEKVVNSYANHPTYGKLYETLQTAVINKNEEDIKKLLSDECKGGLLSFNCDFEGLATVDKSA